MLEGITTSDLINIVGWFVTFLLGGLATVITQALLRQRKRISWAIISESNLLQKAAVQEIESGFGIPLVIQVNDQQVNDLSAIRMRIGNTGGTEVEDVTLHFSFGEGARVYAGQYVGDLGIYRKSLKLHKQEDTATIEARHINRGQSFDVDFLVVGYPEGAAHVDMAESGVTLKRMSAARLEQVLGRLAFFSLGLAGVRYDPTASQTAHLVEEVRRLRTVIEKALPR